MNKILFDLRYEIWVEKKLMMLWSDTGEFKRVGERVFSVALLICFVHLKLSRSRPFGRKFEEFSKNIA